MTNDPPRPEALVMYGQVSDEDALDWTWVDEQLRAAGTYWLTATADDHPHPRPVWGVWGAGVLHLSVGSPVLARQLAADGRAAVHLDSGVDVVIVEGRAAGTSTAAGAVAVYDAKYDWSYDVDTYGAFTVVEAERVIAWRSAGWAGREGFRQTGRWRFDVVD